jgi:predicted dehydrogenase
MHGLDALDDGREEMLLPRHCPTLSQPENWFNYRTGKGAVRDKEGEALSLSRWFLGPPVYEWLDGRNWSTMHMLSVGLG